MEHHMKKLVIVVRSMSFSTRHPFTFVTIDAEKFPNSRQLATVDNLPTFAAFRNGALHGQVQTNKFDVLKAFVDEVAHH